MQDFKNSSLAFIGGVHGVGKSTYCREVLEPQGFKFYTASSLIRESSGLEGPQMSKGVDDVVRNQRILIESVKTKAREYPKLVLDGHYCLLNNQGGIDPIPIWVFESLAFDCIGLIEVSSSMIYERLLRRDGVKWKLNLIEDFQKAERRHAQTVAKAIGIDLVYL